MVIPKGLTVGALISGIILLVIIFNVAAEALPELNTALTAVNNTGIENTTTDTGLPFRNFFNANGLIMLGVMAGILLAVFAFIGFSGKGRR